MRKLFERILNWYLSFPLPFVQILMIRCFRISPQPGFGGQQIFIHSLPAGLGALCHGGDFDSTYIAMWRHFADCILRDAAPICSLEDGRASLAVALACIDSAASGRAIDIRWDWT